MTEQFEQWVKNNFLPKTPREKARREWERKEHQKAIRSSVDRYFEDTWGKHDFWGEPIVKEPQSAVTGRQILAKLEEVKQMLMIEISCVEEKLNEHIDLTTQRAKPKVTEATVKRSRGVQL